MIVGIREQCKSHGVGLKNVPDGWMKGKNSSIRFKNPPFVKQEEKNLENVGRKLIEEMKVYSPKYPKIKRKKTNP